ncbi:tetratricopeptide repeat protein [Luteibacter aegosomatissinici]|uniref:tetratricopeptide repeat protein n=1 Tax=Luteibacter aegosomatissinici TaxID=2911539 RepID=UPI001FFB30A3|nr:tetratricopeptide repeat protein [Luteibacter aegosomatissinici]UPG96346.1 tetratricopeptide repeat protein [Luteibacter aegosomatissinici]
MSNWFYAVAAAMLAVALALLLVPMVRHGRTHGRSRAMFTVAALLAVALPLASIGLYAVVGTPATLNGVEPAKEMTVGQAVDALKARLAANPGDIEGWLLLGQTYTMVKQPAQARDAYEGALKADPKNVPAMVGWAEADSLVRGDHRIEGRGLSLLEQAVAAQPDSQKALWLLGIAQFQQERYTDAAATWRKLQPLLDPDSNVAHAVAEQINLAEKRAAGTAQ